MRCECVEEVEVLAELLPWEVLKDGRADKPTSDAAFDQVAFELRRLLRHSQCEVNAPWYAEVEAARMDCSFVRGSESRVVHEDYLKVLS
jgi:hypothetical protein